MLRIALGFAFLGNCAVGVQGYLPLLVTVEWPFRANIYKKNLKT